MLRCVGSCPRAAGCDYCTQRAQLLGWRDHMLDMMQRELEAEAERLNPTIDEMAELDPEALLEAPTSAPTPNPTPNPDLVRSVSFSLDTAAT